MKVRLPKAYLDLSRRDKDIIDEVCRAEIEERLNKEYAKLQRIWLKFACIVLNKGFGFGRKRCLLWLANWREAYRLNSRMESSEEQKEYLDEELDRIFKKDGYPEEFVDKLEKI